MVDDPFHSVKGVCHIAIAGWIWTNMVVNYYLAVFISPGSEPLTGSKTDVNDSTSASSTSVTLRGSGDTATASGVNSRSSNVGEVQVAPTVGTSASTSVTLRRSGDTTTASGVDNPVGEVQVAPTIKEEEPKTGMEWKLQTSHYCKICQSMVPYMDHHCPFTGSCVGFKNYSYFFLWLVYGVMGLGYAIMVAFPYFNECLLKNFKAYLGFTVGEQSELCEALGAHSGIAFPVLGGFWVSGNMLLLQLVLLLTDLSTYGALKNILKVPVLRFAWHRVKGRKFMEQDSRLNVLLLNQRRGVLWFLVPVMNEN